MKLLGLFALVGWYATAREFRRRQREAGWSVRCLNCQTVIPLSRSRVIADLNRDSTKYSMDQCDTCANFVGVAVEKTADETPSA